MNTNQDSNRVTQMIQEDFSPTRRTRMLVRKTTGPKILFVTNAGGFGGTEKHLIDLVERVRLSGGEPLILQLGAVSYTGHVGENEILRFDEPAEKLRTSLVRLVLLFRNAKPDAVVFINSWVRSFPWLASFAAFVAGVPKRYSIQHLIAPPLDKVEGWSLGKLLRRLLGWRSRTRIIATLAGLFLHKIICVSDAVRDYLVQEYRFPPHKTVTIHNGVSLMEFTPSESNRFAMRAKLDIASGEFLLVCVARLDKVKGIDILLAALAQVLHQGVSCKCVIVGDGPLLDSLLAQAEALGLGAHVFFEGFHTDVRPYLQCADAFVLTSHEEGLPLSILEAMACGLPCIVTDVGGNAEAVRHKVNGLVIAPGSTEEVASAISFLIDHPVERSEMSRKARSRMQDAFDIEVQMSDLRRCIMGR